MADNEFILLPIPAEDVEEAGIEPFLPFQTYVHNGKIIISRIDDDDDDFDEADSSENEDDEDSGTLPCNGFSDDCPVKYLL